MEHTNGGIQSTMNGALRAKHMVNTVYVDPELKEMRLHEVGVRRNEV